jgi:hypothetical protein
MSSTTSTQRSTEPGAAFVTPMPKWTEVDEPGGVRLDDSVVVSGGEVGVLPPAQRLVELLGPVDV